jgi:alkaline phosphatase D
MIGDLQKKLAALHLPIDLIVVADHGMVKFTDTVSLSDDVDLKEVKTEGPLLYPSSDAEAEKLYEAFKAHPDPHFNAYRRASVPADLHFDSNPREGDPVIVPTGPYNIHASNNSMSKNRGGHGFDPHTMPQMKAIFFAAGPDIRPHTSLPTFENINIYPFIAQILGLTPPAIDGKLDVLQPALKTSKAPAHSQ